MHPNGDGAFPHVAWQMRVLLDVQALPDQRPECQRATVGSLDGVLPDVGDSARKEQLTTDEVA